MGCVYYVSVSSIDYLNGRKGQRMEEFSPLPSGNALF